MCFCLVFNTLIEENEKDMKHKYIVLGAALTAWVLKVTKTECLHQSPYEMISYYLHNVNGFVLINVQTHD